MTACQGGRIAIGKRQTYGFAFTVVVLLFELKCVSVGLTFEDDLVTGVGEPIEEGVGDDRIGEERRPVSHGTIRSEDDAFGTEAPVDDGVEALSGFWWKL